MSLDQKSATFHSVDLLLTAANNQNIDFSNVIGKRTFLFYKRYHAKLKLFLQKELRFGVIVKQDGRSST